MNRTPISPHRLGNRIRIKDGPSTSFPFPFVRIARCRESVVLERLVRTEGSNAEQSCAHIGSQVREPAAFYAGAHHHLRTR